MLISSPITRFPILLWGVLPCFDYWHRHLQDLSYCSAVCFKVVTPQKTAELMSAHSKFTTTAGSAPLGQNALLTFKMSDVMVFRGMSRGSCICTSCSSARIQGKSWGQEHKVLLAEPSSAVRWAPPKHLFCVKLKERQWLRKGTGNSNLPQQQNLTLTCLSLMLSIIVFSYSVKLWGQPTSLTAEVTSHFFKRYTLSCPELPYPVLNCNSSMLWAWVSTLPWKSKGGSTTTRFHY